MTFTSFSGSRPRTHPRNLGTAWLGAQGPAEIVLLLFWCPKMTVFLEGLEGLLEGTSAHKAHAGQVLASAPAPSSRYPRLHQARPSTGNTNRGRKEVWCPLICWHNLWVRLSHFVVCIFVSDLRSQKLFVAWGVTPSTVQIAHHPTHHKRTVHRTPPKLPNADESLTEPAKSFWLQAIRFFCTTLFRPDAAAVDLFCCVARAPVTHPGPMVMDLTCVYGTGDSRGGRGMRIC